MSQGIELARERDLGALFRDALSLYGRNLGPFLLLAAAIVAPVHLVVEGIGLGQLTAPYEGRTEPAEIAIPTAASFLVVVPLVTATCIHALRSAERDGRVATGPSLIAGFEAFAPVFLAMVVAATGIALGLLAFIVPGIYLAVRWFFVPQAVVLDGARLVDALRQSAAVVAGFWWRTLGVVLLANLAVALPGVAVSAPFFSLAQSQEREAWSLVGSILAETVTAPFVAIVATLLWFDLRARRRAIP